MAQDRTLVSVNFKDKEATILLEAALYASGRPLDLKILGSVIRIRSKKKVQAIAKALTEEYAKRNSCLELIELDDGRFVLQLKPKYVTFVKRLVMRPLLSSGPLKTLAYIAYRQPVAQAQVVAVRRSQAYSHIQELKTLGLLKTEKFGKTKILRTSEVFADYFNLSHDLRLMKHQLKALFNNIDESDQREENKGKTNQSN